MSLVENIQELCKSKGISLSNLQKELGFGNAAIYRWDTNSPSVEKLQKVADYFNVTIDSLLARTIYVEDINNIGEETRKIIADPNSGPYILLTKKAMEKGMSPETLAKLIELYTSK